MNERQGVELAGGELLVDGIRQDGRAPFDFEAFGLLAATLGDVEPFIGEGAAHAAEDLFGDEVPNRAFHDAPGGAGAQVNQLLREKERLELRLNFCVEIFEALAPMTDHRGTESAKGFFAHFDRARNMQFYMGHKIKPAV